jgi:hypothetical protein
LFAPTTISIVGGPPAPLGSDKANEPVALRS